MTELLGRLTVVGDSLAAWLVPALLWSGALFVVLRSLDELLSRRVGAAWRSALYLVLLVRLMLPVGWETPLGVLKGATPQATAGVPVNVRVSPVGDLPSPVPTAAEAARAPRVGWTAALPVAHAAGTLALLAWMLATRRRIARRAAAARPARAALAALAPLAPRCDLREHDSLGPAVVGVLRPWIVLPSGLVDLLDRSSLRAIIRHEEAHLRRRDPLLAVTMQLLLAVAWPLLPLWLAAHRVRQLMELACDELALAGRERAERAAYVESLLAVAALSPVRVRPALGLLRFGSGLRSRVRALQFRRRWPLAVQGPLTLVLALGLALAAGTRPGADESRPPVGLQSAGFGSDDFDTSASVTPGSEMAAEAGRVRLETDDGQALELQGPGRLQVGAEPGSSPAPARELLAGVDMPDELRRLLARAVDQSSGGEGRVELTDGRFEDARIRLRGRVRGDTMFLISRFLEALEEDPHFGDVRMGIINKRADGADFFCEAQWITNPEQVKPVQLIEREASRMGITLERLSPKRGTSPAELLLTGRAESRNQLFGWKAAVEGALPDAKLRFDEVTDSDDDGLRFSARATWWPEGRPASSEVALEPKESVLIEFRIASLSGEARLDAETWRATILRGTSFEGGPAEAFNTLALDLWLQAAEKDHEANIGSTPRIMVDVGEKAELESVMQIPIVTTSETEIAVSFVELLLTAVAWPQRTEHGVVVHWSVDLEEPAVRLEGSVSEGDTALALTSTGDLGVAQVAVWITPHLQSL